MNKQVILKNRPVGNPDDNTWALVESNIPEPTEGEVLVKTHYISLDPAMRGWMNKTKSYIAPVAIDDVMRAGTIGEVIKANNHPIFKEGDVITLTAGGHDHE